MRTRNKNHIQIFIWWHFSNCFGIIHSPPKVLLEGQRRVVGLWNKSKRETVHRSQKEFQVIWLKGQGHNWKGRPLNGVSDLKTTVVATRRTCYAFLKARVTQSLTRFRFPWKSDIVVDNLTRFHSCTQGSRTFSYLHFCLFYFLNCRVVGRSPVDGAQ